MILKQETFDTSKQLLDFINGIGVGKENIQLIQFIPAKGKYSDEHGYYRQTWVFLYWE